MLQIKKGATDRSVDVLIIDSGDGTPETGVVYNTSGIDLWYRRDGGALVSITEATLAALTTAHADGGFLHIANGVYRLDLPDAAFASGANKVSWGGTVTGMIVIGGEAMLVDYDPQDTVRLGLTALPNAAAAAAGGLPVSTLGSLDLDQIPRPVWQGTLSAIANGTFTLPGGHGIDSQAQIVIELLSGTNAKGKSRFATHSGTGEVWNVDKAWNADSETLPSGTITARIFSVPADPATNLPGVNVKQLSGDATAADNAEAFFDGTGYAGTGNVIPTVSSVTAIATGGITAGSIATDAIGAAELAADAVAEIQSGLSTLTAAGVRSAIGLASANLDTQLDALPTNAELATALGTADDAVLAAIAALNNLSQANIRTALGMASANLDTQLTAIDDAVDSEIASLVTNVGTILTNVASILAAVDTEVAAIKAKTDNLPAAPAATGDIPTAVQNADALLGRNIAGGSSTGRTVTSALRRLRNKVAIVAGTLTTYQEDDTTADHTAAVTTASGNPITSIDPT